MLGPPAALPTIACFSIISAEILNFTALLSNFPLKRNEKSTILPKIMVKSVLYFKYSTKRCVIFRFILYLCLVLVKMSNPLVTSL